MDDLDGNGYNLFVGPTLIGNPELHNSFFEHFHSPSFVMNEAKITSSH